MKELQKSRQVFEEARPYGSHDAEAAYRRTRSLPTRRLVVGSTVPSARSSLRPNCASVRAAAPTTSWRTGRSSTKLACASIRRAISPATRPRAQRWAIWREVSNAIRNSKSILANRKWELGIAFESGRNSAWNSPSPTASTLEGVGGIGL